MVRFFFKKYLCIANLFYAASFLDLNVIIKCKMLNFVFRCHSFIKIQKYQYCVWVFSVDRDVIGLENESFHNNTCVNRLRMAEYATYFLSYDLTAKIITDFMVRKLEVRKLTYNLSSMSSGIIPVLVSKIV